MNKITEKSAKIQVSESAKISVKNAGCPIQSAVIGMFAETHRKMQKKS